MSEFESDVGESEGGRNTKLSFMAEVGVGE